MNVQTVYQLLLNKQKLREDGFTLSGINLVDEQTQIKIGWDRGNGQAKLASSRIDGTLITREVPNVHRSAEEVRAGERVTTYGLATKLSDGSWSHFGQPYWIGEEAFVGGQALQIGSTDLRLTDVRQIEFDLAVCVQFLRALGLKPGSYNIVSTFALPNNEIILPKPGEKNIGILPATRKSLKTHYFNKWYKVQEKDKDGHSHEWILYFDKFGTQSQTMGSFIMYTRSPSGKEQTHGLTELNVYDLGFGDTQVTQFTLRPKYRMVARRLGDGMRRVAEGLVKRVQSEISQQGRVNQSRLNIAKAQMIVRTKKIISKGKEQDISKVVADVTEREGANLAGEILEDLRTTAAYCIFVGGATKDKGIRAMIERHATHIWGDEAEETYHVIDESVASEANAIGAFLTTAWHFAAQG